MATERELEVYRQLRASQDKYIYFLLAAAGAAIALAVNQTQGATVRWSQVPLGLAVLSWALSFFCGCRHLAYASSTLCANAELFKVEAGQHPEVGNHAQRISAASEGIRSAMETNSNRASQYAKFQFRSFVGGAVLYIAWHVWEMWLRT